MDLKDSVTQIIRDELGDAIDGIRFTGSFEGEEFNVIVALRSEPDDLEERETRLRRRVRELGYDIGIFVEYPEVTLAA